MRTRIAITCLISLTACIKQPVGVDEDFDAGADPPSRRRQRIDAGQTTGPGTFRFIVSMDRRPSDGGYPFPPPQMGAPVFMDGWEVQIDHVLVYLDNIALYEDPDRSPSDPTQVGAKVAELRGPWVVDLRLPGRSSSDAGVPDGGADGGAGDAPIVLGTLGDQNLAGHLPFDPSKRYALGYENIRPDAGSARSVNLDNAGESERPLMLERGYGVYYIGSATWRGMSASCQSTDPSFDFSTVPTRIRSFLLGFRTPTLYMNCQNPDLPGGGIGTEAHPRGVKVSTGEQIDVQLTLKVDQLFWENYDREDPPLHFDQFAVAARLSLGSYSIRHAEDPIPGGIVNQNYTAFTVPWRWCRSDLTGYGPPDNNSRMDFESGQFYDPSLPRNLMSNTSYRDYYDLASHLQSGQGYLNGRGRCAVQRGFSSRP
jgi:hypothetical protein